MATTVTASTLTVGITESIELNGRNHGNSNVITIDTIADIYKRIVTVPASTDTTIVAFKQTVGPTSQDGSFMDKERVKYIRITNLDNANSVGVSLQIDAQEDNSVADMSHEFTLEPGMSWIYGSPHNSILVDDNDATIIIEHASEQI